MEEKKRGFWSLRLDDSQRFNNILALPFLVYGIDTVFSRFYYAALGKGASGESLRSLASYGSGRSPLVANLLDLFVVFFLMRSWYRPIRAFIEAGNPDLRETVRGRIASVYPAFFALFGILFAAKVALHLLIFKGFLGPQEFFRLHLPGMAFSTAVTLCFSLVTLDHALLGIGSLMERLYTREELYVPRQGMHISFGVKIAMLLLSTAVAPMLLLAAYMRSGAATEAGPFASGGDLLLYSFVTMGAGFMFVMNGLQRPIDGLVAKMRRLASGDFDVKTRIYFNDEVARLKASFNRMADQLKERELLRETFGKYVSVEVAKKLMESGKLDLGGEELEATVLFCDIRNFTPMSERMTARQVVDFLNQYFSYVTQPIMEHNGVINKFMGDAVMAVYAPPLGSEDHVGDALRSALGMREALKRFNESGVFPEPVRFGVGIQTGSLVAGNVGTMSRLEYTVIGDTVNVASRLQSATKDVGVEILVGEKVRRAAGDAVPGVSFRAVGPVSLKGKAEAMQLYAVE